MTRYRHHVLPSGMVVTMAEPAFELAYGTPASPPTFFRIKSPEEIAAGERRVAAGKALVVLREAAPKPRRVRRLKAEPWPSATLALGDEAPAAMISDRAQGGRSNAVLPARVEPGPLTQGCSSCVLGALLRLPPLGFPLVPLSDS